MWVIRSRRPVKAAADPALRGKAIKIPFFISFFSIADFWWRVSEIDRTQILRSFLTDYLKKAARARLNFQPAFPRASCFLLMQVTATLFETISSSLFLWSGGGQNATFNYSLTWGLTLVHCVGIMPPKEARSCGKNRFWGFIWVLQRWDADLCRRLALGWY